MECPTCACVHCTFVELRKPGTLIFEFWVCHFHVRTICWKNTFWSLVESCGLFAEMGVVHGNLGTASWGMTGRWCAWTHVICTSMHMLLLLRTTWFGPCLEPGVIPETGQQPLRRGPVHCSSNVAPPNCSINSGGGRAHVHV